MNIFLGLTLIAAASAAWILLRSHRRPRDAYANDVLRTKAAARRSRSAGSSVAAENATAGARNRSHFRATSIHAGDECCQAAARLHETRFLLEDVPRLPLEDCDRISDCQCVYRNHEDRRCGDDRRNVFGALSKAGEIGMTGANQRTGMDRRADADDELEDIEFEI